MDGRIVYSSTNHNSFNFWENTNTMKKLDYITEKLKFWKKKEPEVDYDKFRYEPYGIGAMMPEDIDEIKRRIESC